MSLFLRRLLAAELVLLLILAAAWSWSKEDRTRQRLVQSTQRFLEALGKGDDATAFGEDYLRPSTADKLLELIAEIVADQRKRGLVAAELRGVANPRTPRAKNFSRLLKKFPLDQLRKLDKKKRADRAKARGLIYSFLGELYRMRFGGQFLKKATIQKVEITGRTPKRRALVTFKTRGGTGEVSWVFRRMVGVRSGMWELDVLATPQPSSKKGD